MRTRTKQAWQSEFEPRLQLVLSDSMRAPASLLEMPCEFSLTRSEPSRNALNEVGERTQGSADSPYVNCAAIKNVARAKFKSRSKSKTNKGERP